MRDSVRDFLYRSSSISARTQRRLVWIGLFAEALFLGLSFIKLWSIFGTPAIPVSLADNNITILLATLRTEFPFYLLLIATVILLALLPGWIASSVLEDHPTVIGSILLGFGSLGGLVLASQFLHVPSIWPSLGIHLAWQVALWWFLSHRPIEDLRLPTNWQCVVLALSMLFVSLFALYFNPVLRLDTTDNWIMAYTSNRIAHTVGTISGTFRNDLDGWFNLMGWITNLTAIPTLYVYQWLGSVALLPLAVLLAFGIVRYLTDNLALATASAWFTMLVLVTSALPGMNTVVLYLVEADFSASDKWVSLVLLVPAGLTVLARTLNRPASWRTLCLILAALGVGMLFHPEGLTVMGWLALIYIAFDLILNRSGYRWQKVLVLLACLVILFVVIPGIFPATHGQQGSTRDSGLQRGVYTSAGPDWFILNPAQLLAPLLLVPLLFIVIRGIKRSESVPFALHQLLFSWVWAALLFFIPPFANFFDQFWYPSWLERFLWTLPFGILAAVSLTWIAGQRRRLYLALTVLITVGLLPISRISLADVDWRLTSYPVVDREVRDLTDYFRAQGAIGVVLSALPGPQTLLFSELGPTNGLLPTNYGFPEVRKLYTTAWWGTKNLKDYIVGQVNWVIAERSSQISAQLGLQPPRYQLSYENSRYLVYRVKQPLTTGPIDDLIDILSTPDKIDLKTLLSLSGSDPYSQVIVGQAYQAMNQCDNAIPILEKAAEQSIFARPAYVQALANCQRSNDAQEAAARWRDDPDLATTLLSEVMLRVEDNTTFETAVRNWLARPYVYTDEAPTARTVARNIALIRGRPDQASAVLHRLPDVLFNAQDWYDLAYWAALAGHPDPALFRRAGRNDLALLWEGHTSTDLTRARASYQAAVDQSHSATAYMFLGQTCEALDDYSCAKAAYQSVMNKANDPMVFYGALAYAHIQDQLHENADQTRQFARKLAAALSLTYREDEGVPALRPILRPAMVGQVLHNVTVAAQWAGPLGDQMPAKRVLNLTVARSVPENTSANVNVGVGNHDGTPFIVYVPDDASVMWPVSLALPTVGNTTATPPDGPVRVWVSESGSTAFVADMPSWLPPKTDVNNASKPLTVFGSGLQLVDAITACNNQGQTQITLTWLPTKPIDGRYTLFLHAVDSSGEIVAQVDTHPFNDAYPTDAWLTGYPFQIVQTLPVHDSSITFRAGLYLSTDSSRMPLQGDEAANGIFTLPPATCS